MSTVTTAVTSVTDSALLVATGTGAAATVVVAVDDSVVGVDCCCSNFCFNFSRFICDFVFVAAACVKPGITRFVPTLLLLALIVDAFTTLVAPCTVPSFSLRNRSARLVPLPPFPIALRADGGTYAVDLAGAVVGAAVDDAADDNAVSVLL